MLTLVAILAALGPEFAVAPGTVDGPAAGDQGFPHGCFADGGVGLLAWEDSRCAPNPCLLASRIDANGQLLDPGGLQLATEGLRPRVACGARAAPSQFLVAWTSPNADIWATSVTPTGVVSSPFPVYLTGGVHTQADIVTDGTRYLVVWSNIDSSGSDIFAAVLETDGGTVVAPHSVASLSYLSNDLTLASSGAEYLVAWTEETDPTYHGLRLSPNAVPLGAPVTFAPAVARHDVTFAGGWVVAFVDGPADLRVRWLDPMLQPLGPDVRLNSPATSALAPAFAVRAGTPWLAWGEDSTVRAVQLRGPSDAGVPLPVLTGFAPQLGLVSTPSGFLLGASVADREQDLIMQPLTPALTPATAPVQLRAVAQLSPALAVIGDTYLVAWREEHDTGSHIAGRRVARDGTPLGAAFDIQVAASGSLRQPAVAAAGQTFLVAWVDSQGVRARRYSVAGALLDASPLLLAPTGDVEGLMGLGSDGAQFLLVVMDDTGTMRGRRFSPAGVQLGATFVVTTTGSHDSTPFGVAGAPDAGFLVTWSNPTVFAARVTGAGTVLDPGGFHVVDGGGEGGHVTAGWDGQRFHVAHDDNELYENVLVGTQHVLSGHGTTLSTDDLAGLEVNGAGYATLEGGGLALAFSQSFKPPGVATPRAHKLFVTFMLPDAGWEPLIAVADDVQQQTVVQIAGGATSRAYVWSRVLGPPEIVPTVLMRIETLAYAGEPCALGRDCAGGVCVSLHCASGPSRPDAGLSDAGPGDAGAPDAGPTDAGPTDAGPLCSGTLDCDSDGGIGPTPYRVGCGCDGTPGLLALGAALLLRSRSIRRPRQCG